MSTLEQKTTARVDEFHEAARQVYLRLYDSSWVHNNPEILLKYVDRCIAQHKNTLQSEPNLL